jgi:hypothetical protein
MELEEGERRRELLALIRPVLVHGQRGDHEMRAASGTEDLWATSYDTPTRGHQRSSVVIRGHQRSSVVIGV